MSFALPTALALAAFAIPIIGFYILKVRLRRIPVSTNLFWNQIFEEKPPRSIWQNLRHLVSLLLQLLLLLLLVLAIADPYFPWQLMQARRIVIVIDNSASMRAEDVAPSRFEAARAAARELIEGLRFRDEAAVVVVGKHPEVVVGMTNHIPTLRRAVDGLTVGDTPTESASAVDLGKQLIGDRPNGEIVVFTDGCLPEGSSEMPEEIKPAETTETKPVRPAPKIVYRVFGTEAANVGITQFQVRRSFVDPIGYEALASIHNASGTSISCRLELTLDDVPIDVLPINLKPDERWTRSIEKTSLAGGTFRAELTQIRPHNESSTSPSPLLGERGPGGEGLVVTNNRPSESPAPISLNSLPTDDVAWAILPPRQFQNVLLVSPGNLFLQKVLEANPLVKVTVSKTLPTEWPSDAIIVLHELLPEKLPSGDLLVIDPSTACDYWDVGATMENPIVTEQDKNSPLMTHIRLDNVLVPQAKQVAFKTKPSVLAGTIAGEPIYAEVKRAEGKCLVLNVGLDQSDLAFRTAFPIMATNALSWFADQTGEWQAAVQTGSTTTITDEKLIGKNTALRSPSGNVIDVRKTQATTLAPAAAAAGPIENQKSKIENASTLQLGPFDERGVWSLVEKEKEGEASGSPSSPGPLSPKTSDGKKRGVGEGAELIARETFQEFAVNLSDERETDLRPLKALQEASKEPSVVAGWLGRPLWFYLAAIACLLTTGEWYLYQRRIIT